MYKTRLEMTNCVGVIDSGYRGEVSAKFRTTNRRVRKPSFYAKLVELIEGFMPIRVDNYWDTCTDYRVGDRFAQIIIMPYPEVEWVEADALTPSDRGVTGYGGSGR